MFQKPLRYKEIIFETLGEIIFSSGEVFRKFLPSFPGICGMRVDASTAILLP